MPPNGLRFATHLFLYLLRLGYSVVLQSINGRGLFLLMVYSYIEDRLYRRLQQLTADKRGSSMKTFQKLGFKPAEESLFVF